MNILALTKYTRKGASSRLRSYQYIPYLVSQGHRVTVAPLFEDRYLDTIYSGRKVSLFYVLHRYIRRLSYAISINKFDLLWIEKEIFPYFPLIFENSLFLARIPYVVDFDDAIFHNYDLNKRKFIRLLLGKKIDIIMKNAILTITCNEYLKSRALMSGSKWVEIIPTSVDTQRYRLKDFSQISHELVIGWIGTPKTQKYLEIILPVIRKVSENYPLKLVVVGGKKTDYPQIKTEFIGWSEETEVEAIKGFDIGVMPLFDGLWERGKCGYKIIQYMACGVPVIASPIGINKTIIKHGVNGFFAASTSEWEKNIMKFIKNREKLRSMGLEARKTVEMNFSLHKNASKLGSFLRKIEQKIR